MTTNNHNTRYLEIILGPMFSGKTSRIVEIYKQCLFCNIPVIVINHSIDNRYDDNLLATHDKVMIPCVKTNKLLDLNLNDKLLESNVILINEAQFFDDLYDFIVSMLTHKKKIYVCGLDGDYKRNKFGQILDIIPLCDTVVKLTSLCGICKNGTRGIFSKRISSEQEQTVVGNDNYIPVCHNCYENTTMSIL
jgi:thymidine kinase